MKKLSYKFGMTCLVALSFFMVSCDDQVDENSPDFNGTFTIADQMGRPGVNTVFVPASRKDEFNQTMPAEQAAKFQSVFEASLKGVNPGYTTNALGLDATTFTTILATDVLSVSTKGKTTFFDGTNVLTGRALNDDVIDVELLLIFGGPNGSMNAGLTSDNVDGNDKEFLSTFPYLASPW